VWQLFAQDQWSIKPNLSLALGLRYALQTSPASFGNLVPRVGIAWSPDHKQRWVIHVRGAAVLQSGDAGCNHRSVPLEWRAPNPDASLLAVVHPTAVPTPSTIAVATRQFAAHLGQSWSFQSQLGVEHELPQHWHAQANLFDAQAWGTLRSRNINAPLVNDSTPNPLLAPRPIAPGKNIFQFEQSGHLHGQVVFLGVDQHSYKRFGIFVGYLYFNLKTDADSATLFPQSSYSDRGKRLVPPGSRPTGCLPSGSSIFRRSSRLPANSMLPPETLTTWSPAWITTETGSSTTAPRSLRNRAPAPTRRPSAC
jgi:hypothetical protein